MRRSSFVATSLLVSLVLVPASTVDAQAFEASHQTWLSATLQGNVTPELQLYLDVNGRFYDFDAGMHPFQVLVRPAVGLRLAEGMYGYVGYGWTPSWSGQHVFTDEHRLWEQWTYDLPGLPGGVRVFLRTRLEQRARPEVSPDVALRARQLARMLVPIVHGWPLHLSLWDEAFVGLTDSFTSAGTAWQVIGFDQNRLFVGLSTTPAQGVRVEAGYMNHWVVRHARADDVHHVLAINAFVTFQ